VSGEREKQSLRGGVASEAIPRIPHNERLAGHIGFWWGLAEGLFFFVVPDVYISLATLLSLRAGAIAWAFSILGSLVAVCTIYLLMASSADYLAFLTTIPAISETLIARVRAHLSADGLPYDLLLARGGVPLKVYAGSAFAVGMELGQVMLWTVFARTVRIAPTYLVAAGLRVLWGRRIDQRPATWIAAWAVFWLVFYLLYFARMGSAGS
jgi:hypothetical protein